MKDRYIQITSFLIALLSFTTFPACEVDDEVNFVTEQEPVTKPELMLPKVSNPGAGKTTIVLYVPENTPAGCYAVGDMNGWNVENTEFRFMPVQGVDDKRWVSCTIDYESYMKMKVLAIPNAVNVSLGWAFQWGKNMDSGNDLEEDNVVILDGVGTLLLENQGQPMLCEVADNGVVYIQVKSWETNPPYTPNLLKGSKVWTILVDTVTAQVNASKIVADFGPDDEAGRYLYIWENSYSAGNNWNSKNFYGVSYDYISLLVGNIGWAGCGFNLPASDSSKAWEAAEALRTAIVANPDDYYLHMALKSTDNASHCFYIFNTGTTKFTIGSIPIQDGPIYANFTRDGEWAEFDIPMSRFATALAAITCEAGMNIFVALSEGISGAQLNMDAIYFFKKADGDNISVQKTSPSVTTAVVTQITETSAVVGGNVTSDGNASVTERGVVYSTNPNPVITNLNNTIRPCGSGTGEFTYTITGLQPNTTYYVRAYAKNDAGTAYGEEVSFTTNEEMVDNPPSAMPFSVSADKRVTFSKGNLQYTQSTDIWSFAESQLDIIGTDNVTGGSVSSDPTKGDSKLGTALADKIDLFGWSTSATNFGVSTSEYDDDYSGSFVDWGMNKIGNDAPNTWRTLTYDEWYYLRYTRTNADDLVGIAQVNGVNGLILLPDNWVAPDGIAFKSGFHINNGVDYYAAYQTFTAEQWSKLEFAGAVFLPAAGSRYGSNVFLVQDSGYYWSATEYNSGRAYCLGFDESGELMFNHGRFNGISVRLVKDL